MLRIYPCRSALRAYAVAAHYAVDARLSVRRDKNDPVAASVKPALNEQRRVDNGAALPPCLAFAQPCVGCGTDIAVGYAVQQSALFLRALSEHYRPELTAAQRAVGRYHPVAESLRYLMHARRIRCGYAGIFPVGVEYRDAALADKTADLAFSRATASGNTDYLHICPPHFNIFPIL